MSNLYYCRECRDYALGVICFRCKNKTVSRYPPRFSPQDRYGRYRRLLKKQMC